MWRVKLCMGVSSGFDRPIEEQIRTLKAAGFEGFFTNWQAGDDPETVAGYRALADELGMLYQSIHAPFYKAAQIWEEGESAAAAIEDLMECLQVCGKYQVPVMVVHAFIGFEDTKHTPNLQGIENFRPVVEEAKRLGVKIALENTEGEEYLAALMEAFKEEDTVGFCLDTGHEMCYNRSQDLLALYGDRLIATHLNDNLGIRDYDGRITFHDDLHLLPFDGIADWKDIVERMNRHQYRGPLTFELKVRNSEGRHEHDGYLKMSYEEYIWEAYKRACKVGALKMRAVRE